MKEKTSPLSTESQQGGCFIIRMLLQTIID